jgi:hypothetical protein
MGRLITASTTDLVEMGSESARIIDAFDPNLVGKAMYDALTRLSKQ